MTEYNKKEIMVKAWAFAKNIAKTTKKGNAIDYIATAMQRSWAIAIIEHKNASFAKSAVKSTKKVFSQDVKDLSVSYKGTSAAHDSAYGWYDNVKFEDANGVEYIWQTARNGYTARKLSKLNENAKIVISFNKRRNTYNFAKSIDTVTVK